MRKTLLLVFIHGFKGGDDTFGTFPEHLRALISHALPNVDLVALTYPKFETRGELKDCVERFREWLQDKVIDLEVAHSTPSPTVDPSVHTVLIGHSMGGIVAAETVLLLANDQPLAFSSSSKSPRNSDGNTHPDKRTHSEKRDSSGKVAMFPHISGLLAFDTPFLGISPGVIAHGAEGHYQTASSAYSTISEIGSAFGWGGNAASTSAPSPRSPGSSAGSAVKSSSSTPSSSSPAGLITSGGDAAASPRWQSWGKYAMFAGAAGAVAAGGAAALYSQREKLSSGWGWVSGHLEFVGCLVRGEDLRGRVTRLNGLTQLEMGSSRRDGHGCAFHGSAVFYTLLGRGANTDNSATKLTTGERRTFCKLPPRTENQGQQSQQQKQKILVESSNDKDDNDDTGMRWLPALNDKSVDEISAHTSMFHPRQNPGFYGLAERAKDVVLAWVEKDQQWYESSSRPRSGGDGHPIGGGDGVFDKREATTSASTATTAAAAAGGQKGKKTHSALDDDDDDDDEYGWEPADYNYDHNPAEAHPTPNKVRRKQKPPGNRPTRTGPPNSSTPATATTTTPRSRCATAASMRTIWREASSSTSSVPVRQNSK